MLVVPGGRNSSVTFENVELILWPEKLSATIQIFRLARAILMLTAIIQFKNIAQVSQAFLFAKYWQGRS